MITIIKTTKTLSRYEEQSILSAIENLSRQDKQGRLLFTLLEAPLQISIDKIKKPLQEIIQFRLKSIHFTTIKQAFKKYNVNIIFSKKQTRKQKINTSIINSDHNHFMGRGNKL